jgi:hypothetical protein
MADLPRGVPFIDLIVPAGTAAKIEDVKTRIELVTGGAWMVRADDGTMEQSAVPLQPVRGREDRIQVYRTQQFAPGEGLQTAASLAVEVAGLTGARLAAVGIYGVYAWGIVLVEDAHWLHGLILLDWLFNPQVDDKGEIVEDPESVDPNMMLRTKLAVFQQLWTPARSALMLQKLPPGSLQQVENHQALMLLGQGGQFDPRYWQSFSMQLALEEVREFVAGVAPGEQAPPPTPDPEPEPEPEPDDGLTPLARALREAAEREAEGAEAETLPEPTVDEDEGSPVRWATASRGQVLWLPEDRCEPAELRKLREAGTDGLRRRERPSPEALADWREAGAHFVTRVAFASRLFLDGKPAHKTMFTTPEGGLPFLDCHLPRMARVRAWLAPPPSGEGRAWVLVCSDPELPGEEVLAIAAATS